MKAEDATHEIIDEAMNEVDDKGCYDNLLKLVKDYREKIQDLANFTKRVTVF